MQATIGGRDLSVATRDGVEQFLRRYQVAFPESTQDRAQAFRSAFERLQAEYEQAKEAAALRVQTEAPGFNVFHVLGVHRAELRHSAFLADLLDPHSSHGQGELFLHTFLAHCRHRYGEFPLPDLAPMVPQWSCYTEWQIRGGRIDRRIDIVLCNPDPVGGGLYFIENKVDALEQDGQLAAYAEWLDAHRREYPRQSLIFLTPDGRAADSAEGHPYFRLSYREDIAGWLDGILAQIQAPRVRETVRQYIETVKRL